MAAIYEMRGGGRAALRCPVDACVFRNGLSLSEDGWNPFRAVAEEMRAGHSSYEGSVLQKYYQVWQPSNALEALLFDASEPEPLENYPAYTLLPPWYAMTPTERMRFTKDNYERELREANHPEPDIKNGFFFQGPASEHVGRIEYRRCLTVFESIEGKGYERTHGDISVMVLMRDDEYRFQIEHGHHRVGAVGALDLDYIPSNIRQGAIIDVTDVDYWAQVRRGIWPRRAALDYFHHLFDFDSRAWADTRGLISSNDA
jgi:hypothetical protein